MNKLVIHREVPVVHLYPSYPRVPNITVEINDELIQGNFYKMDVDLIGTIEFSIKKVVSWIGCDVKEYHTAPVYSYKWFDELDEKVKEYIARYEENKKERLKYNVTVSSETHEEVIESWFKKLFKNTK